jgi:predicted TIM-barrel fold metal-dependent hydrolase
MAMPTDVPIIDCMIGFPFTDMKKTYEFIVKQTKDAESKGEFSFPVEYMFKDVPHELESGADPIAVTLGEMDKHNIEKGLIGVGNETSQRAIEQHPDRFIAALGVDPNDIMGSLRRITEAHEKWDIRAVDIFPCGLFPQIRINAPQMYPVYAKCVELGISVWVNAGVPGPRLKMDPQRVEYIDDVMYDFPDLVFVTRHGCEPWEDLAVKLMLKWPGLHYCTSAFAPKHYPKAVIDYANTRGADKIIYAGYFPMGLSIERIMSEMPQVAFNDDVWPKFLRHNAERVLGLTG